MSSKKSGVNYSKTIPMRNRREAVIERYEAQLKSGVKPVKKDNSGLTTPLTEKDITRIKSEIKTLKSRV